MGIVNVTPDSFSDGGQFSSPEQAVERALEMLEEGADILDIGGESTRPGSKAFFAESGERTGFGVSAEEESARVLPVIEGILRARPETVISVDTYKAVTARAAVEAGAEIVNDVSAGRWDRAMYATIRELGCGYVMMHMRGRPDEWRKLPPLRNAVELVSGELQAWAQAALSAGIARERIVLDPGFGFGKNFEENYPLLAGMGELARLAYPLLAGASRKSFIGRTLARDGTDLAPSERLFGTLATVAISILQGAHIVRVHDVRPAMDACHIADAVLNVGESAT